MSSGAARLCRGHGPGLEWALAEEGSLKHLHLTLRPRPGEDLEVLIHRLAAVLADHEAQVVRQEVFGSVPAWKRGIPLLQSTFGEVTWPITWIEGRDCFGGELAGVHIYAVAGTEVHRIGEPGRFTGTLIEHDGTRQLWVGELRPENPDESRSIQAGRVYETLERVLSQNGMALSDLVRTWFFLDRILEWYAEFNEVRNEVCIQRRLSQRVIPASTGVGARNPSGTALMLATWAMRSSDQALTRETVGSPLQCPAPGYGSSFSRAVELRTASWRHLLVSGTASIDPVGRSAHPDDILGQIELTMKVVEAIFQSRNLNVHDITRATAYIKRREDAPVFAKWWAQRGLGTLPVVTTQADICRAELLFELEVDAIGPVLAR